MSVGNALEYDSNIKFINEHHLSRFTDNNYVKTELNSEVLVVNKNKNG